MHKILTALLLVVLSAGSVAADPVRMCYRTDAKPFSYVDDAGRPVGFTIDICRRTARHMGDGAPRMIPVTARTRFDALQSGKCDMLCGATTASIKRRQEMEFSFITFVTSIAFLYDSQLFAPGFDESKPVNIGYLRGTTAHIKLDKGTFIPGDGTWEFSFVAVDSHAEGAERLNRGELQAYIGDREIIESMVQEAIPRGKTRFAIGLQALSYEPYAIAVRLGDDARRIKIDETLADLFRTGDIEPLLRRHVPQRYRDPTLTYLYQLQTVPE